jgi:hypothetical protein
MQTHKFYSKYANTKVPARTEPIKVTEKVRQYNYGLPVPDTLTLSDIYNEVDRLERQMGPLRLRQEALIDMAEQKMMENQA